MACCSCVTGRGTREMAGVRPRKSNCHRHVLPLTFYLPVWVPIGRIYTQNLDYCSYCDCLIKWEANINQRVSVLFTTVVCILWILSHVLILFTTHTHTQTKLQVAQFPTEPLLQTSLQTSENVSHHVSLQCMYVCMCTYRVVLMYVCVCVLSGRVKPVSSGVTFCCAC